MGDQVARVGLNRVSLVKMIELGVQKTYHDLTVLAELLPRKHDFERKVEIVTFSEKTRLMFIRLLALVKWAGGASKIEQCMDIVSFLEKQALLFTNTADNMYNISRNTLAQARLPPFQLPCAVEVLTLGTYSRMPTCVRDKIVPPKPISVEDKRATLDRLNYIIEQRLSNSVIHPSMRNLKVEFGRVTFHVDNEFVLTLTLFGDTPIFPWVVLNLELLAEDADAGEGKDLVNPKSVVELKMMIQRKMNESTTPLYDVFVVLHSFCLSLQIEVLHEQMERLHRDRPSMFFKITEHIPGQKLSVSYWRGKNFLVIQTDQEDLGRPFKLTHNPRLKTNGIKGQSTCDSSNLFKRGNLSIEYLITDTIHRQTLIKLIQLSNELQEKKYGVCVISGVPALLHVSCLEPCAPSEELIISIDLNGSYLAHVPQYEKSCPLAENIQDSLNSNRSKLGTYFDQLKIWLTKKRCIKTVGYLPVTATENLPLCSKANHAKLDDRVPRLFFQFNKYNQYYLMTEFYTSDSHPFSVKIRYSLLTTESAMYFPSDVLDIDSENASEGLQRDFIVVENIFVLDVPAIVASSYNHEPVIYEKNTKLSALQTIKREPLKEKSINTTASNLKKNNLQISSLDCFSTKSTTQPAYVINVLPHVVGFCAEHLTHLALEKELRKRNIKYEVSNSDTSGSSYCISITSSIFYHALAKDTILMNICHQEKANQKIWLCQYLFKNCPVKLSNEHGIRFVFMPYDSALATSKLAAKFIDDTMLDWACMAHLYEVVKQFSLDIEQEPEILNKVSIRSFNYKKFIVNYGPKLEFSVTINWRPIDKKFHLTFSIVGGKFLSSNPHSCLAIYYKQEFNQHKSIKRLVNDLNTTLGPMSVLVDYNSIPIFGPNLRRPIAPVLSFCLVPISSRHVRLMYKNFYCFSIKILSDNSVIIRDGALSLFDRSKIVEDLSPMLSLDALIGTTRNAPYHRLNLSDFARIFNANSLEQALFDMTLQKR